MALLVKSDGTAVVEEPKVSTAAAGAVADSGETVKETTTTKTTKTEVPEAATAGMDFKTVQQNLNATYNSKYEDQLADLYNQIVQRKPFEYSTDDDMLYQQYLQKYTQQGKQAMKDTMGQTAALTGGYGNSYGQVAGQQAYDEYLRQLNNLIPELQDAAYKQYAAEGDRLTQLYGLLGDMDEREMNQFKLNQTVNQGAYERFMNEAALKGAAGDFSGYADIFGKDSANKMKKQYEFDRLLPLFEAGIIPEEAFGQILNPYLSGMGIDMSALAEAAAGSGDVWDYGGVGWNPGYMNGTSGGPEVTYGVAGTTPFASMSYSGAQNAVDTYKKTGRLPGDFYT